MKRLLLTIINSLSIIHSSAQESLSLEQAYDLAQKNYPLIKQRELISKTKEYTISNLSTGFFPQLNLSGQATYQSEVTSVKVPIPGVNIESPSKHQYKVIADISQLIYDGGLIRQQKNIQDLSEQVEQQKINVELYKLKERINQLFVGILFLDEQLKQIELIRSDLNNGIKRVEAQVNNGTAFRSNLNVLQAELLKTDQRQIELKASRDGYVDVLSLFINQSLAKDIKLEKPVVEPALLVNDVQRPELKLYSTQEKLLGGQYKLIDSRNKPKASVFWQGGYGRPGLNFLSNNFDFYYTAGIRLNWNFGGFYTRNKEKKIVELNQKTVEIQTETFLLNTNTDLKRQLSEVEKLQKLVATDNDIIELRARVKDAAKAQLENGVITANDYLREVNAEDQARQSLITHQIQLLQAQIIYQTLAGRE
ncbi:MAG TPA: TolC family protein [Chitinophagaceae bacterium]|nr:TolC family protein [Chitinophagaceae bacterium]